MKNVYFTDDDAVKIILDHSDTEVDCQICNLAVIRPRHILIEVNKIRGI